MGYVIPASFKLPFLEAAFVHGPNLPRIPNIFGTKKLKLDFWSQFFSMVLFFKTLFFSNYTGIGKEPDHSGSHSRSESKG